MTLDNLKSHEKFIERLTNVKPVASSIIKLASLKLKIDEDDKATLEDYAKLAFSWHFLKLLTIKPSQAKEEIIQLLGLGLKFRRY